MSKKGDGSENDDWLDKVIAFPQADASSGSTTHDVLPDEDEPSDITAMLERYVADLDEERIMRTEHELALALLYLASKQEGKTGKRRAKKAFRSELLTSLMDFGFLKPPLKQGPVILTDEGSRLACSSIMTYIIAQDMADDEAQRIREELDSPRRVFRLRIELELWDEHPCWREIVVPADYSFAALHHIIQASFLWWGYHCFEFTLTSHGKKLLITNKDAGGIDTMFAGFHGGSGEPTEAYDLYLDDVFPRTRTARYVYDYGDYWEHKIRLVETIEGYDGVVPACLDGEGDAPPEDVGSVDGFEDFLRIINNKKDPEHENMVEWGRSLFYEPYSLEAVNRRIDKWISGEVFDEWDERNGA